MTVWSTFTLLPVAFCSDDFCNRNMRVRSENSENQLFLNVIPHNPGNWLSVLPVVTTSVLEAVYSQVWLSWDSSKPEREKGEKNVQRCKTLCATFPGVISHLVKQSVIQSSLFSWMNLKSGKYKLLKKPMLSFIFSKLKICTCQWRCMSALARYNCRQSYMASCREPRVPHLHSPGQKQSQLRGGSHAAFLQEAY